MYRLNFRRQTGLGLILALLLWILAPLFHEPRLINLSFIIYGSLFFLHPVWPEQWSKIPAIQNKIRLTGLVLLLLGLWIRFDLG